MGSGNAVEWAVSTKRLYLTATVDGNVSLALFMSIFGWEQLSGDFVARFERAYVFFHGLISET